MGSCNQMCAIWAGLLAPAAEADTEDQPDRWLGPEVGPNIGLGA